MNFGCLDGIPSDVLDEKGIVFTIQLMLPPLLYFIASCIHHLYGAQYYWRTKQEQSQDRSFIQSNGKMQYLT